MSVYGQIQVPIYIRMNRCHILCRAGICFRLGWLAHWRGRFRESGRVL
jgi:hypothetical protein